MYGLDLFSGIGGITKALDGYVRPVAYCEIDEYARAVLLSRMATGDLPIAPIWQDIRTLDGTALPLVDIIYGGFPCQDISVAGRGAGLEGERSGLFFEIVRLAQEIKPGFIFLENVPNIRTKGLSRVIRELADNGYDCRWMSLSAAEVGANHKRERWFLLAYSEGSVRPGNRAESNRQQSGSPNKGWWTTEPNVGRVANGIPSRVDRVRALGNAVVPAQVRLAFETLVGFGSVGQRGNFVRGNR